jgi:hypothetical protein
LGIGHAHRMTDDGRVAAGPADIRRAPDVGRRDLDTLGLWADGAAAYRADPVPLADQLSHEGAPRSSRCAEHDVHSFCPWHRLGPFQVGESAQDAPRRPRPRNQKPLTSRRSDRSPARRLASFSWNQVSPSTQVMPWSARVL